MLPFLVADEAKRAAVLPVWTELASGQKRCTFLAQLWAATTFRPPPADPAQRFPERLLILSSAADRLVDPRCSADLARHYGAEHRAHPWAGHDLTTDDGEWVADAVAGFALQRRGRGAAAGDSP